MKDVYLLKLPCKYSKKWLYVLIALFLITFFALLALSMILKMNVGVENTRGFLYLSVIIALVIGGGGFLGAKAFFYTAFCFDIIDLVFGGSIKF
jgi:hypothetical protein